MFNQLKDCFDETLNRFMASPPMQQLASSNVTAAEYGSFLRQIYYVVRENPQLQALATVYFRGNQREQVRNFFQHATSEVGHDQLALNDFEALGFDATNVPYQNPLPASSAMTAFAFYQIYNLNPVGYLGYLFFLEFLPTQAGGILTEKLREAGVPDNAMTFIRDHIEIDQAHNRLMKTYADQLLKTPRDLDASRYAIMATSFHYEQLLSTAISAAHQPVDTGWNWEELDADGIDPASLKKEKLGIVA